MSKPFGLLADLHQHNWQSFSTVNESGINSRLEMLHDEIKRCAVETRKAGGDTIYVAGDVFHVRGSIAPSVLNPTLDVFRALVSDGFIVRLIPGNHDLESKHSKRISNAVTSLEGAGVKVCHEPILFADVDDTSAAMMPDVLVIPWFDKIAELKTILEGYAGASGMSSTTTLILHAPIDGVIGGLPAHGLTPEYLAGLGFKRVFAGHYHHHKDFENGVISIGALAHHTWSDVGSKAGFLVVSDGDVRWFKSHTPEFVDLVAAVDESEAEIMAEGNYVRARITSSKTKDINELREWLMKCGAKGVVIQTIKETTSARVGGVAHTVGAGASVETSIADYVKSQEFPNGERVQIECQKILAEVEE